MPLANQSNLVVYHELISNETVEMLSSEAVKPLLRRYSLFYGIFTLIHRFLRSLVAV